MNRLLRLLTPWYDEAEAERKERRSVALANRVDRELDRLELARVQRVRTSYSAIASRLRERR